MERKVYMWVGGLLGAAALIVVVHLAALWDSIPPILTIPSGEGDYALSRNGFGTRIVLDAFLLPVIFAATAYAAHRGRQVDVLSWLFVAAFYLGFCLLWGDVNSAAQPREGRVEAALTIDPIVLLGASVFFGAGFWKWKQNWDEPWEPRA